MNASLPTYPQELGDTGTWKGLDVVDQYDRFDTLLGEAEQRALFDALPESPTHSQTKPLNARGETIAERLWLLGYFPALDKAEARVIFNSHREAFLSAVSDFQKDAGLVVDRWPGIKTWQALSNLVSFESDNLDPAWLHAPEDYPAVLRAVHCRLFVLGLASHPVGRDFEGVEFTALRRFKLLALMLGAIEMDADAMMPFLNRTQIDGETLSLLLDQDRLIAAVSRSHQMVSGTRHFVYKPIFANWDHRSEVRAFLIRLVQVEFWLLGYPVGLMDALTYPMMGFDDRQDVDRSPVLQDCLADFAVLAGFSRDAWRNAITPELFMALNEAETQADETAAYRTVEAQLQSEDAITQALEKGKGLHLRIWDGMKRVLRWFGRLFRKAVQTVLNVGQALARFFYHCAQQAFDVVKKAVGVVVRALGTLDGTDQVLNGHFVSVRVDGDVVVGLAEEGDSEDAFRLVTFLRLNAERFALAAQICVLILKALLQSAFGHWVALAKALFSHLGDCVQRFQAIYQLESEMDRVMAV